MNVLFTGASSPLGAEILSHLLASASIDKVVCTVHQRKIPVQSQKLQHVALDLNRPFSLDSSLPQIDLLVHLAAVTHARNPEVYRRVNFEGSLRLIEQARAKGCGRLFYVSTRCVGPRVPVVSCGAYAESKRALEEVLEKMNWGSLVVLRPAEVYGAGGTEGIDQLIRLARTWRVVPMIVGNSRVRFAPVHYSDFLRISIRLLESMPAGVHTYELCGPDTLDGPALARALAKRFGALPIPVWYPLLAAALSGLRAVGMSPIAPDQLDRLLGDKSSEVTSPALVSGTSLTSLVA